MTEEEIRKEALEGIDFNREYPIPIDVMIERRILKITEREDVKKKKNTKVVFDNSVLSKGTIKNVLIYNAALFDIEVNFCTAIMKIKGCSRQNAIQLYLSYLPPNINSNLEDRQKFVRELAYNDVFGHKVSTAFFSLLSKGGKN